MSWRKSGVCIPTEGSHTTGTEQSHVRPDAIHDPNSDGMDEANRVSTITRPPMPPPGTHTGPEPIPGSPDLISTGIRAPTPRAKPALSGSLANHRQSLENQGFSKEVV